MPNFKTTINGDHQATWSLAAFTTAKNGNQQLIDNIIPLPKTKVITNPSGLLGRHANEESVPFRLNPANPAMANAAKTAPPQPGQSIAGFPLTVGDYVNSKGKSQSFNVWGNPAALQQWQARILQASGDQTKPYSNKTGGLSFPKFYRQIVESNLSDLLGTPAVYIDNYKISDQYYITFRGRITEPPFKAAIAKLAQLYGGKMLANGQTVFTDNLSATIISSAGGLLKQSATQAPTKAPTQPSLQPQPKIATKNKAKAGSTYPERESFPAWLDRKFGNDPHQMMNHLSDQISMVADQAQIDWQATAPNVIFNSKDVLTGNIKDGKTVHNKIPSHQGSVALGANTTLSRKGDIRLFSLNFINKKVLVEGSFNYNPYNDLNNLYQSEVWQRKPSTIPDVNREKLKEDQLIRAEKAQQQRIENIAFYHTQVAYWKNHHPGFSRDIYQHNYYHNKGLHGLEKYVDLRISGKPDNPHLTYPIVDINMNFVGVQKLLHQPMIDEKGKKRNKKFNHGFSFSNPETGEVLGTHCLIGEIKANEPIGFVEGLADGYTAFKARGHAIVVCLSKSNMDSVIHLYRAKHPNNPFLVFGDNDIFKPKTGNPGAMAALEASYKYQVDYSLPRFNGLPVTDKPTDFNDLEKIAGLDLVKSQMANLWQPPSSALHYHGSRMMYCGLDKLEKEISSSINALRSAQPAIEMTDHQLENIFIRAALTVHSSEEIKAYAAKLWQRHRSTPINKDHQPQQQTDPVQAEKPSAPSDVKSVDSQQASDTPDIEAPTPATLQTPSVTASFSERSVSSSYTETTYTNNYSAAEHQVQVTFAEPYPKPTVEAAITPNAGPNGAQITVNANGHYTLVQFNTDEEKHSIEQALTSIFPSKTPLYNEVLKGFIAPHDAENLIRSYLYQEVGSPRLYFGRPITTEPGSRFIIRGDFGDQQFKDEIAKALSLVTPIYKPEEFGFEISSIDALEFVESAIAQHLQIEQHQPHTEIKQPPVIHQQVNQQPATHQPIVQQAITAANNEGSLALTQATHFSGLAAAEILDAHLRLSHSEPGLLSESNYVFAAIYARQERSFSHQTAAAQHKYALGATLLEVNALLANLSTLNPVVAAQLFAAQSFAQQQYSQLSTPVQAPKPSEPPEPVPSTNINLTSTIDDILALSDALKQVNSQLDRLNTLNPLIAAKLTEADQLHPLAAVQPAMLVPGPEQNHPANDPIFADESLETPSADYDETSTAEPISTPDTNHEPIDIVNPRIDEIPAQTQNPAPQDEPVQSGFDFEQAPSTDVTNNALATLVNDEAIKEPTPVTAPADSIAADFIAVDTNEPPAEILGKPSVYPQVPEPLDDKPSPDEKNRLDTVVNEVIDEDGSIAQKPTLAVADPIANDFVTPKSQNKSDLKANRAKTLLAFTRQFIKTNKLGHQGEHFADQAIKSVGSPYYDPKKQRFDPALLAADIKYINDNPLPNWQKGQQVSTAAGLYYALYNEIANQRLSQLNDYIAAYIAVKGVTHNKTFMKYFSGQSPLDLEIENPYLAYGRYDKDFLDCDLDTLTEVKSVNEHYRHLVAQFQAPEQDLVKNVEKPMTQISVTPRQLTQASGSAQAYYQTLIQFNGLHLEYRETADSAVSDGQYLLIMVGGSQQEREQKVPLQTKTLATNTLFSKQIDDHLLRLKKVLIGSLKLYVIEDIEQSTSRLKPYDDFLVANQAYKRLLPKLPTEALTDNNANSTAKPALSPTDIRGKIDALINQEMNFTDAIIALKQHFSIAPADENALAALYNQSVNQGKTAPIAVIPATPKFAQFHQFMTALATDELFYDECFDEAFRPGGAYYQSNPYFNPSTARVDTAASRKDLKDNGYPSFKAFYEGIFSAINHRASHEVVLARAGGYIPSEYDINEPIGLQYSQLSKLLTDHASAEPLPLHLPTFKAWMNSTGALGPIHPVLAINLTGTSAAQLTDEYDTDALLLLADVHGAPVTKDDDEHTIANKVLDIWSQRRRLLAITVDEFASMSVDELTLIAADIGLTTVSNSTKMAQQIASRLAHLKDNSHLRLAQYSYIKAALSWEQAGRKVPAYVSRNIYEITTNESLYRNDAKEIVKKVAIATLRQDIDQQLASIVQLDPISRKIYALQSFANQTVVGLAATDFVKEGDYRYRLLGDTATADLSMPEGISYYNMLDDKMIATPTPLPNDYLAQYQLTPITDKAVVHSLSSIKQWITSQGYGAFYQQSADQLIVIHPGDAKDEYFVDRLNTDNKMQRQPFANLDSALISQTDILHGFCDRDILVEDYIELIDQSMFDVKQSLQTKLKATHSSAVTDATMASIVSHLAAQSDHMALFVADYAGESNRTIVQSFIALQLARVSELAYQKILGAEVEQQLQRIQDINAAITIPDHEMMASAETSSEASREPTDLSLATLIPLKAISAQPDNNEPYLTMLSQSMALNRFKTAYYQDMPQQQANELALHMVSGTYQGQWQMLHHQWVLLHGTDSQIAALDGFYHPSSDIQLNPLEQQPVITDSAELNTKLRIGTSVFYDFNGGLIGEITEFNGALPVIKEKSVSFVITQAEVSAKDRPLLFNDQGIALYSMDLPTFLLTPKHQAKFEFSEIDQLVNELPLSTDAQARQQLADGLQSLSLKQLSGYAKMTGTVHAGDRTTIEGGIYDQALVLNALSNTPETPETLFYALPDDEKARFARFFGNTSMDNWLDIASQKLTFGMTAKLSSHYEATQKVAQQYGYIRNDTKVSGEKHSVINTDLLTVLDHKRMFDTLSKQRVDALWVDKVLTHGSDNTQVERATAIWLSQLSHLTPDTWHNAISQAVSHITFEPVVDNATLLWQGKNHKGEIVTNSYSSIIGALEEAENLAMIAPVLAAQTPVAWIDEALNLAKGMTVHDIDESIQDKTLSVYLDVKGNTKIQHISLARVAVIDVQANTDQFNALLKAHNGHFDSLLDKITTQKTQALENQAWQSAILFAFALEHAQQLKQSYLTLKAELPAGENITIENGRFLLTSANEAATVKPIFDTLQQLAQNQLFRKRIKTNKSLTVLTQGKPAQEPEANDKKVASSGPISTKPIRHDDRKTLADVAAPSNPETNQQQSVASPLDERASTVGDTARPANRTTPREKPTTGNHRIPSTDELPSRDSRHRAGISVGSETTRTRGIDFFLPDALEGAVSGLAKHRADLNIKALNVRQEIKHTARQPTAQDKQALVKYSGWGGLASILGKSDNHPILSQLIQLVDRAELDAIKRSSLTAFYTPPSIIHAMWDIARHLGFDGGRFFDPSTGTGHFIGATPKDIAANTAFSARELDNVTADIAQMLYGENIIKHQGYEKAKIPPNYFDLMMSNIPFGDFKVFDPEYRKDNHLIHDFFILKSLDKVREGGVIGFITSTGTMDKANTTVREKIAGKADLIGAIRLPRETFGQFAGTQVSADILYFQKRFADEKPQNTDWVNTSEKIFVFSEPGEDNDYDAHHINNYFIDNPQMIIGEAVSIKGQFGRELAIIFNGDDIAAEIKNKVDHFPAGILNEYRPETVITPTEHAPIDYHKVDANQLKPGSLVIQQGEIHQIHPIYNEALEDYELQSTAFKVPKTRVDNVKSMIELRDQVKSHIRLQLNNGAEQAFNQSKDTLNQLYDQYIRQYGPLNTKANKALFKSDPDAPLLLGLEFFDSKANMATKADIFTVATIRSQISAHQAESPQAALHISLGVRGKVDPSYISNLLDQPWDEIHPQLADEVYLNPANDNWEASAHYLSGNIKN